MRRSLSAPTRWRRPPTMDEGFGDLPGGEGAATVEVITRVALPPLAEICLTLKELQTHRRFCIRLQSKCDRATEALIARAMGYHGGLPEGERKKLFAAAGKLRREVERGGEDQAWDDARRSAVSAAVAPLIIVAAQGRAAFDRHRKAVEKEMRRLARDLPAWRMAEPIAGFSDLGLAVIVGEAGGDLSRFTKTPGKRGSGVAKLWKRLGLAVIGGVRQGGLSKTADANEWVEHGYNPERRAEIWVIGDVLLRQQWRGEKEGVPGHAVGLYGEHYARKKADYLAREWPPLRAHRAARRYMTKCLIRDLWASWRHAGH